MFKTSIGEQSMENPTEKEKLLEYTDSEVEALLKAYEKYKLLASQLESEVDPATAPKFSFGSNLGKMQNFDPKRDLRKELEKLGESMKFQNPLIWLLYKHRAYATEPGRAICTLQDLIQHCEVDGICHRRFDAINLYLRRKYGGKDMASATFFDPSMDLQDVGNDTRYIAMCLDIEFMDLWRGHENSRSGKWHEYELSSPDHDCEVNCTC